MAIKRVIGSALADGMRVFELLADGSFRARQDRKATDGFSLAAWIVAGAWHEVSHPPKNLRWYLREAPEHHEKARAWLAPYNPAWVGVYEPKRGAA